MRGVLWAAAAAWLGACAPYGPDEWVTYHQDIAPLMNEHCQVCHTDGRIAPFVLDDYESVWARGPELALELHARTMPPWLVDESGECGTFRDSLWMDQADIDMVADWVTTGMLEGRPEEPLEVPDPPPGLEGDGITVLDPGIDYSPVITYETDDLHCFVTDPELVEDAFLTAFEIVPGEPSIVHHLIVYRLNTEDAVAQAYELQDAYDGPGYPCFGGPFDSGAVDEAYTDVNEGAYDILGVWQPGQAPTYMPDGTGLRLHAATPLVMRIHYYIPEGTLPDRTTINLDIAAEVEREATIHFLADYDMVLPPGQSEAKTDVEYSLDDLWGEPVELLAIMPHQHDIGETIRVTLRGGETPACLSWTPTWDFNWQQFYFYEEPVPATPDQTIRLDCTYDTSERTEDTIYGEGAHDEMCVAAIIGVPLASGM